MIPTVGTKISGYFFSLIFPFAVPLTIAVQFSLVHVALFVSSIILESYITHRMLKRPCTFVVPRMFAINFVAFFVEGIVFAGFGSVFVGINLFILGSSGINPQAVSPEMLESTIAYPLALLGLIGTIVLFYVRWKVFCKMFAWFDKSVSQVALRKTMLYVVGASYFFWIVVMCFERFFKITF
jgi:hypothetical protein